MHRYEKSNRWIYRQSNYELCICIFSITVVQGAAGLDDLPVVVWEDDTVDFWFGGFIVSMNSARALQSQGCLGASLL